MLYICLLETNALYSVLETNALFVLETNALYMCAGD